MSDTNIKKKLIKLFATHSAAEIDAGKGKLLKDALGVEKYRRFVKTANDDFNKYYLILKELRGKLDNDVMGEPESAEQVKGCLYLLRETKEKNPSTGYFDLLTQLIRHGLYDNWPPGDRKYYDAGWEMLAVWKDYFLSYTGKNCIETNNDFGEILTATFGNNFTENKEKANWVAALIAHHLGKINGLTSFFDRDEMKCGDDIHEEIFKNCTSVYAFVQLVEPLVFQAEDESKQNWCFHEYKTFAEWSSQNWLSTHKRYYFILTDTETNVFPANFPGYYNEWKEKISMHKHIVGLSALNKNQVRDRFREIAVEIVKTRNDALDKFIE
ncbi:MAG: hypothetical protein QG657_46 [Acidobacteriota bacterium]|nr:hypothetical protein [Acidobacteriota bacterium]